MNMDAINDEHRYHGEPHLDDVPDQADLKLLARSCLEEFVQRDSFSFFTGNCDTGVDRAFARFEQVGATLESHFRQQIIDEFDEHSARAEGDQWQVYKYARGSNFWSVPADIQAVMRVVDSIPDELSDQEADCYGPEFLDTVRAVKRRLHDQASDGKGRWGTEGF